MTVSHPTDSGFDFRWVLPGALAGASQPGLRRELASDLAELETQGIRLLVSLTETPLVDDDPGRSIRRIHFPIADMGIPTPREARRLCLEVERSLERREAVALHCRAGLGRTGMMLACYLATEGLTPEAAISAVRKVCIHHIQNVEQERFVHHYVDFLASQTVSGGAETPANLLPPLRLPEPEGMS